jgi:kynureninase
VATRDRLRDVVEVEWGQRLVGGWERWLDLSREVGDLLAGVLGAHPGEVVLADSTSVNLYKLATAALDARPGRRVILTEPDNFPTDLYVLQGIAEARGAVLDVVEPRQIDRALGAKVALVCLSHVGYGSGAVADLPGVTAAAHEAGALVLWDLCHSAGAVPVRLADAGADLAVGCTYKHLNGGPGSPAFLYVRRDLQARLRQPIWGWFGQVDQFAMGATYQPMPGIERFLVGTPPILSGHAALEGVRLTAAAGIDAIAAKCRAVGSYAIELADAWLTPHGFALASPREEHRRAGHITLRHPQAWQICQAWQAARVIADFRTPDRLRLGLPALYTRFVDVYAALDRLRELVAAGRHQAFPAARARIT